MRTSIYKEKIIKLLKKNHLLSIGEIHQKIPEADYSTIYRNVYKLLEDKKIKRVVFEKGKTTYESVNEKGRHDHFFCIDCEKIKEINIPFKEIPLSNKYKINDLLVRGLCENCNKKT